jgi:hypothetical protein
MKPSPRFILAKYVPDLNRMEPRNIGVFLWSGGSIRAQFLDAPSFVNERRTYDRWRAFWEHEISGKSIAPLRGKPIPLSDPACMDALLATQEGNYILVDAGEMLETVSGRDLNKAITFLFNDLVATDEAQKTVATAAEGHESLRKLFDAIIKKSGIQEVKGFTTSPEIECPIRGIKKHLHFTCGIQPNGSAKALYQRVNLDRETSVHDAALKFENVINNAVVPRERCIAVVRSSQVEESENGAMDNLDLLKVICNVVDVDDEPAAVARLRESVAG